VQCCPVVIELAQNVVPEPVNIQCAMLSCCRRTLRTLIHWGRWWRRTSTTISTASPLSSNPGTQRHPSSL